MAIRYDDSAKTLKLSVRDLVENGAPRGHLAMEFVQRTASRRVTRMAQGQRAHVWYQMEREAADAGFQSEVRVKQSIAAGEWTATLQGRVDGLTLEGDHAVVEELKSSVLTGDALMTTHLGDWPAYVAQLEVYLWMLHQDRHPNPAGRLVLISLADGSRHVLGVPLDADAVGAMVQERIEELVEAREKRLAWMASRRTRKVPCPHPEWREGQREIVESVHWGLDAGNQVLIEAPTGLGKTDAALVGALRHAMANNKQVFWATARTTQQRGAERAVKALAAAGLSLRTVTLKSKTKSCLNDVIACRPDACKFAESYYDKLRETSLIDALVERGPLIPGEIREVAVDRLVCPFELSLDLSEHVDVVIGDYNYVFDPSIHLRRHFGDTAGDWVVVVDEAHQLVERARGYGSPSLSAAEAREVAAELRERGPAFFVFAELAADIAMTIAEAAYGEPVRERGHERVVVVELEPFEALSRQIDDIGLEYALRKQEAAAVAGEDPWIDLARRVMHFTNVLKDAGEETVVVATTKRRLEKIGLLNLDPSPWLGPRLATLGGFVGLSATLTPTEFYARLLGLETPRLDVLKVPSSFPPERRKVLVAPRVSTAFKDREEHAPATAAVMARCVESVPGNVAVYFPSFAMRDDIVGRWALTRHELLLQEPAMSDERRQEQLDRLGVEGQPAVLAAVLGGIFAEGIDLPPGALSGVFVAGPAFPPVGLERDLLREYYESLYGEGWLYASLIPGMTRVIQAVGRLIRRPEDRGVVVLFGRRFRWRDVAALVPESFGVVTAVHPETEVASFFAEGV